MASFMSLPRELRASCIRRRTPARPKPVRHFWQVDDLEREMAELKARGVNFEKYDMPGMDENGISTAGGTKAAWFKDTGNIMTLIQGI